MIELLAVVWIVVFVIFLVSGIAANSPYLGLFAGIVLLIFGLAVVVDGLQYQSGVVMEVSGGSTFLNYSYAEALLPFSTYSVALGLVLVLAAGYIIYANAEDVHGR